MSKCRMYRETLKDRIGGNMALDMDEKALKAHLDVCPECRHLSRLHALLEKEAGSFSEPAEERFGQMREAVRKRILDAPPARRFGFRPWALLPSPAARAAVAAGLILFVAAGSYVLGRLSAARPESLQNRLVRDLYREVSQTGGPAESWDSKYMLTNVSIRRMEDGKLDLGFDLTTRVRLKERPDVPLVRELLLQSLLNAENPGSRIKALSNLENLPVPQAVEALIFALHNDPVPAVRISAFDILAALPGNPIIEAAMLRTLGEDVAVEMRLRALDYLAGRKADPARIRESIEAGPADSRPAVRFRAAKLLSAKKT